MDAREDQQAISRLRILARLSFLWGLVILGRLVYLQVFQHDSYVKQAEAQQLREIEVRAPRGEIFDRNGARLALSLPVDSVCINPLRVPDKALAADLLSRVLEDVDKSDLQRKIEIAADMGRGFLWVKRKITPEESEKLRSLNLDWIEFRTESRRFYPNGSLAAHIIGSVDHEEKGNAGVEQGLNEDLTGHPGYARTVSDVRGGVIDRVEETKPAPGTALKLTVDERIQYVAENELRAALELNHCRTGSLVVMKPDTGEILAIANAMAGQKPFDPNKPVMPGEPIENRLNLAVSAPFEPGSVFKVVTLSSAFETTNIKPSTMINCGSGHITLFKRVIHDAHPYSILSVADVLAKSSNIGAIQIGLRVGNERLYDYVTRFGFGSKTEVPLPGESKGLVWPLKKWIPSSIGSVAMGHEVMATTVQLAQACSIIANGGTKVKPQLVIERKTAEGQIQKQEAASKIRVLRPETAALMRQLMQGVVLHGTGKQAQLQGYTSAGKTGSAQIFDQNTHVYTHKYNASFMGFAPVNRPAVVVVVTLNGSSKFGGPVAAPVFAKVASAALRYMDVPKDLPDNFVPEPDNGDDNDLAIAELSGEHEVQKEQFSEIEVAKAMVGAPVTLGPPITAATNPAAASTKPLPATGSTLAPTPVPVAKGQRVPDFHGKTKRVILEESMAMGVPVQFDGKGLIATVQDPPAGSSLHPGDRVRVVFAAN